MERREFLQRVFGAITAPLIAATVVKAEAEAEASKPQTGFIVNEDEMWRANTVKWIEVSPSMEIRFTPNYL